MAGRRWEDFLYRGGTTTEVPYRAADFTYVFSYRPTGREAAGSATRDQVDEVLGLLARSHIRRGEQDGPRAVELVPELAELVSH